jgi:hypothetical protein
MEISENLKGHFSEITFNGLHAARVSVYGEHFMYVHEQSANTMRHCTAINQDKNGRIVTRKD